MVKAGSCGSETECCYWRMMRHLVALTNMLVLTSAFLPIFLSQPQQTELTCQRFRGCRDQPYYCLMNPVCSLRMPGSAGPSMSQAIAPNQTSSVHASTASAHKMSKRQISNVQLCWRTKMGLGHTSSTVGRCYPPNDSL
jgi:hypothetical protein